MRSPITHSLLEGIDEPAQLRALPATALGTVADELRTFLLESVARSGGHLASGLGTVELSIALHYCLDTPHDEVVWDVGHQCYPHKILTGRRTALSNIRKRQGISGFLKRDESRFDAFGAGHSSTSISAALGMACAAKQLGTRKRAVAVIGDGALTAGLAFEALDHAGGVGADLLVILNDNGMSISENVGALSQRLTNSERQPAADARGFFGALGFDYHGPIDGHDLPKLLQCLHDLRDQTGPRLLHVLTCKGKGYEPAEADPIKYHGVTPFDTETGIIGGKPAPMTYTQIFGDSICDLAAEDSRIAVVTPAMREGSGLVAFARQFPDRYHDVGIAEQHAVTFAAGLATQGLRPIVAIYSTFLQRAFDQVVHDVALQKLNVVFCLDRGGLAGADGPTHHGSFDYAFFRCIPNMIVSAPMNEQELRNLMYTAQLEETKDPFVIRYPRGQGVMPEWQTPFEKITIGKGRMINDGEGILILSIGHPGNFVVAAMQQLNEQGVFPAHADMRFAKPIDEELLHELAPRFSKIITIEDGTIVGGFGSAVLEFLSEYNYKNEVIRLGIPDRIVEHGKPEELHHECAYDTAAIVNTVLSLSRKEAVVSI